MPALATTISALLVLFLSVILLALALSLFGYFLKPLFGLLSAYKAATIAANGALIKGKIATTAS